MSHVDEGVLHAYLDGELPAAERADLERHLSECAACTARLEEERALVHRAGELLGLAQPPVVARRKRPWWRVRTPVAWAASIILAIALGYSLPDKGLERAPAPEANAVAPAPEVAYSSGSRITQSQQERKAPATPQRVADARAESTAVERLIPPPSATVLAVRPRSEALAPQAAGAPAPLPAERATERDTVREPIVILDGGAMAAEVPRRSVAQIRGRTVATEWPIIRRGSARDLLGADPVGIPGLEVREIRRSPAGDATVLVEQRIDSSTVVQIFQRSTRTEAMLNWGTSDRLARYVGNLRVEIAGPLSQDSLNRLLDQLKPLMP